GCGGCRKGHRAAVDELWPHRRLLRCWQCPGNLRSLQDLGQPDPLGKCLLQGPANQPLALLALDRPRLLLPLSLTTRDARICRASPGCPVNKWTQRSALAKLDAKTIWPEGSSQMTTKSPVFSTSHPALPPRR